MASVTIPNIRPRVALATTYEGDDPALLERIAPLVDAIEITPDTIARSDKKQSHLRAEVLHEYSSVASGTRFMAHGVGLSICSADTWNDEYLGLLDELFSRLEVEWHSEHLAWTTIGGENTGTMFAPARTEEALDLICERVTRIQARYKVPFLLEHVIQLLPEEPAQFTPAGFLNEIISRTGCGLIVDAYNLECDAHNQGLDIAAFLDELNLSAVLELHIAGGVQLNGFQLDIHSRPARDSTLDLALDIIARARNLRTVTYEFLKEAIRPLGHDAICSELVRARKAMEL
jgi:uncharacterized protein